MIGQRYGGGKFFIAEDFGTGKPGEELRLHTASEIYFDKRWTRADFKKSKKMMIVL